MQNNFKIYTEINDELIKIWQDFYNKGAGYSLSPEWCQLWFKYFKKTRSLYIITLWEEDEIKLLAPFYIYKNRLSLIGTKPDMYDEFNILSLDDSYTNKLFDYIFSNKLEINFKHVNSESKFGKVLIKYLSGKSIKYISHVTELKPYLNKPFEPKRKLKDDIKRCKNNAVKLYEDELVFEYNVEDRKAFVEEFLSLHKKRWKGGMLVKKANLEKFIEDMLVNTSLITFSRLSLKNQNKSVAFHAGYLDSDNVFWSGMPVYDTDFKAISPGKVLLNDLISETFNKDVEKFDFGRGSEAYKSWFAKEEAILFNVETYHNRIFVIKIRKFIEKILKKISG